MGIEYNITPPGAAGNSWADTPIGVPDPTLLNNFRVSVRYFELDPDFEPLQNDKRFRKMIRNVRISARKDIRFLSPFLVNRETGHFKKQPFTKRAKRKVRF